MGLPVRIRSGHMSCGEIGKRARGDTPATHRAPCRHPLPRLEEGRPSRRSMPWIKLGPKHEPQNIEAIVRHNTLLLPFLDGKVPIKRDAPQQWDTSSPLLISDMTRQRRRVRRRCRGDLSSLLPPSFRIRPVSPVVPHAISLYCQNWGVVRRSGGLLLTTSEVVGSSPTRARAL